MKRALLFAAALALTACGTAPAVTGSNTSKTFRNMETAGYPQAAGTARLTDLSSGDRATTLTMTGLRANTAYVAHYHSRGTANATDVCRSNGPIVGGTIGGTFTSDASGNLTMRGLQALSALQGAAYINVHEAESLPTVPLCAPL